MESFKYKSIDKFREFDKVSRKYRRKIEKVDDIQLKNFINELFYGKNSYQNVKQYLEEIKRTMDKEFQSYLLNCIESRWNDVREALKEKK